MITDPQIEAYLRTVRAHLGSATASGEEEVICEINSRIQELTAEPDATPEVVLRQLGPAKKLAHQYRDALLITKAGKSVSPLLLLHASLRNGFRGVLAFLLGLAGYWLGGIFTVFGTLTLIWSAIHFTPGDRPAIGSSMFQSVATAVTGAVLLVATTIVLRALLRLSKRSRLPN